MASVYEATDMRLDRTVAVKVMHPGLGDDDEFADRFVREARSAARLYHPNVVGVYDQGDDRRHRLPGDGATSPGHTLRDVIRKESADAARRGPSPCSSRSLSALAAAHRAGLIHRDVKPENVLIADDGRVKVADFGLAKAVSADTQHTATGGVLIGTVSYLAPELVDRRPGRRPRRRLRRRGRALRAAHRHQAARGRVADPGRLQARPRGRAAAVAASCPASRRTSTHWSPGRRHATATCGPPTPRCSCTSSTGSATRSPTASATTPSWPPTSPRGVLQSEPTEAPSPDDTAQDPFDSREFAALMAPSAAATATAATNHTVPIRTLDPPPGPPPADPPAPRRTPPSRPRRRRRGLAILLVALLLVTAGGVGAWWFGFGRYTSTPGVIGLTRSAAEQQLDDAGLEVEWGDPAYSETVPAGRVVDTDPDAGSRVLSGGTVTATVSLGKERYDVPKLKGKTVDQAQDALNATNLEYGKTVEQWSDTVPKGIVLGSTPKAGTTLRPDAAVDLLVSQGPKPVKLKNWVGKDADDAQAWFAEKGLESRIAGEEYSDTVAEGDVISQDPAAGETLRRGDEVSLVVSLGPELVEVPGGLIASGVDAAKATLEDAGFVVNVEESGQYIGLGYVSQHRPRLG